MNRMRALAFFGLLAGCSLSLSAFDDLTPDQLTMLRDSGGWEYISMNDSQDGFPTKHTCFDGTPHPDACSGTLTLTPDNTFTQQVFVHHQTVSRHGTYELNGNQLALFDEFGTRDGPYTLSLDAPNKQMTMAMPQIDIKFLLYKEYRKQLEEKQKKKNPS